MALGASASRRVGSTVLEEDLAHATDAGRTAINRALAGIADGVPFTWLRRCQGEGRDGTRLP